jgi:hypothetical protein
MDGDTLLGCILIAGALAVLTVLTLWSRRTIRRITERGSRSLREIMRDMNGE